ncbi:MAG: ferredoxin [Acidimicrobiales bacterium]|jgi:ferredoxin
MKTRVRIRVDPIACDGRGLCAELLPELISLDDWGYPIIRDVDVPPELVREALEPEFGASFASSQVDGAMEETCSPYA